jgi:hypothetical protein
MCTKRLGPESQKACTGRAVLCSSAPLIYELDQDSRCTQNLAPVRAKHLLDCFYELRSCPVTPGEAKGARRVQFVGNFTNEFRLAANAMLCILRPHLSKQHPFARPVCVRRFSM